MEALSERAERKDNRGQTYPHSRTHAGDRASRYSLLETYVVAAASRLDLSAVQYGVQNIYAGRLTSRKESMLEARLVNTVSCEGCIQKQMGSVTCNQHL